MTKIKIVCSKCGGENVLRDAYASWDVEAQDWAVSSVYDTFRCGDCGHDTCDEVPGDDHPETPEQLARGEGWLPDISGTTPGTVFKVDHGETFTASTWEDACRLEGIELGAPSPAKAPIIANPDIGRETGNPEIDSLIHRLLDAQQGINLEANERMSQPLCDASALLDDIESALRRLASPRK